MQFSPSSCYFMLLSALCLCGIDPGRPGIRYSSQGVVTLDRYITPVTLVEPWQLHCLAAMELIHKTDDNGKFCEISRSVFSDVTSVIWPSFYVKRLRVTFQSNAWLRKLNSWNIFNFVSVTGHTGKEAGHVFRLVLHDCALVIWSLKWIRGRTDT
jgi:hypothetical protein